MIWKSKRQRNQVRENNDPVRRRRSRAPERLEGRRLLAADPIHVGVVYLETDYLESDQDVGSDSRGDRFILSFTGGAADTELNQIRISTDKDGDGISVGDPIYDTATGGRGKQGAHNFQVLRIETTEPGRTPSVTAEVADGGQLLVLNLSDFKAGDRLEFSIDVDEVLRNALDLAIFNDRLDVITSGQEFQDSILEATFDAPHYETAQADAIFLNDYGDPASLLGIDLPPDEGDDPSSRPDRSAAAVASTTQTPKPISISGHVWVDNDLDLLREASEATIGGVQVALWKFDSEANQYVDTGHRATTGVTGRYEFGTGLGLMPGTYRVVESQPGGYFSVGAVTGNVAGSSTGSIESVDVLTGIHIPLGGTAAENYDFAEADPTSISGFVYRDLDNDGVRDAGESGIAGVEVRLVPINAPSQSSLTVRTGSDGSYRFTGLAPGKYEVIEVNQPAGLGDGKDTPGTVRGATVGIADQPGDRITAIMLAGGDDGIEYNFGELPLSALSGYVFLAAPGHDCEPTHGPDGNIPLADVRVAIQDEQGQTVAEVRTGSDGGYRFENLTPGTYQIIQYTPDGLLDGSAHPGRIEGVRVGTVTVDGLIQDIRLSNADGVDYNFCEIAPASVSGYVYHDQSNDGQRDQGEAGIANTTIDLVDQSGATVATTTTDANGRYEFAGLEPGRYSIRETQPNGYFDGIDSVGNIRGSQVGQANANDQLSSIELKQGDAGVEYNFGELAPASIAGQVHVDLNDNCLVDPGEETLADVVIRLLDAQGSEVARTTTNSDGRYEFANLAPGTYTLVQQQPSGVIDGNAMPGNVGGTANSSNVIDDVVLTSGAVGVDYDFCEKAPAAIVGNVFGDLDGDCVRDAGEAGIENVTIELYDASGRLVATTTTDAAGDYRFEGLSAGQYTVRELQPTGWLQGSQHAGSGGGDDSVQDTISQIQLGWGQRLTNYDFCELPTSSITGIVFVDGNGNCVHDSSEQLVAGVTIELRDASGHLVATTTTDGAGRYRFDGLAAGEYQIIERQPGELFDGNEMPGTGNGFVLGDDALGVQLLTGQNVVDYNFCELAPATLIGCVWEDTTANNQFDAGEVPVAGVIIELLDADGNVVAQTVTDHAGKYRFESLRPGTYSVRETQPVDLFHGGQLVGSEGGVVAGQDVIANIKLRSGVVADGYDFPEIPPATISGYVFQDGDEIEVSEIPDATELREFSDGLLTGDDTPIAGVTLSLRTADGEVVPVSMAINGIYFGDGVSVTTDADGYYQFSGLRPGVYHVFQSHPDGFVDGLDSPGTTGGLAVNAADDYSESDQRFVDSLGLSDHYDAILSVGVVGGQHSQHNNFSELVIVQVDDPLIPILPPPTVVTPESEFAPIETFLQQTQSLIRATALVDTDYQPPFIYANSDWNMSWHLSVINAGFPRGPVEAGSSVIRSVSVRSGAVSWRDGQHTKGSWSLVNDGRLQTMDGLTLGEDSAVPLSGDFNGDNRDEVAIYVNGNWYVDLNGNGRWDAGDLWIGLGTEMDRPVVGDWDGDGKDDIGIFGPQWMRDRLRIPRDPGLPDKQNQRRRDYESYDYAADENVKEEEKRELRHAALGDKSRADAVDHVFRYGDQVDTPISGDWNSDGIDQIGIFREGQWVLDVDGDGRWTGLDEYAEFGQPGDVPVVGDFNGDRIDEIAVVRGNTWIIDSDGDRKITANDKRIEVPRPSEDSQPIVGDFDGDGKDEPGYYDEAA